MSNSTTTAPDWQKFGTISIDGTDRTIWKYDDADGRDVFQVTTGDQPTSNGGYHELESLLQLKGVKMTDIMPVSNGMRL
ncbi:hypothetical protein [Rhizobium sp. MHM7A]|uniref:hypothetical protein n=1 Tax=Rhizobium sp. MHM7A TaxID=2583233 RepID=UPI0011057E71|nr:hypothetical protein [Rhizobium sp. MHM7A]TLX17169.1 hypothetical protein FFR93_07620 [Rhizobium sp. MHM7A]